jgi:mannose-6-phosphate isomerase-like protein (cupin superfamily)
MIGGWFIGPFEPRIRESNDFEIAVKSYLAGEYEETHHHKIATEYTLLVQGKALMSGSLISPGNIVTISPGVATDFRAIEDCQTVVVKIPAAKNDKYIGEL